MKDIRVDSDGEFRCWNCGNKGLLAKRTLRSKMLVGVGALATKKKLKCQTCGEYNDTGNAKPFAGPASRKWRKKWEKSEASKSAERRDAEAARAIAEADAIAAAVMAATGAATPPTSPAAAPSGDDKPTGTGSVLPPPSAPQVPAAWASDPTKRHEVRYWDGTRWTEHVADRGVQGVDPLD